MYILTERDGHGWLLRLMSHRSGEVAYAVLGLRVMAKAHIQQPGDSLIWED